MVKVIHGKVAMVVLGIVAAFVVFVLAEVLYVAFVGAPVVRPNISKSQQTIGEGSPLRFVVMGDSTAVSQGGEYSQGFAAMTAAYLANGHTVTWSNLAVPGSRAADVNQRQMPEALTLQPDVALLAVGANDVIHLTNIGDVVASLAHSIDALHKQNPNMVIVLTGSPDMGSVPRFPQPLRWLAGERTKQLNARIVEMTNQKSVLFAPIAAETGQYFRSHPEAFASDKFHPTTEGYSKWTPVIINTLNQ